MNFLIGFLSGATAAMGLGGGFILLVYLTSFAGVQSREAGAINLIFFIPVALISLFLHFKNKLIETKILPTILFFGVIGIITGFILAEFFPALWLKKIFASLVFFVGARELFSKTKKEPAQKNTT